MERCGACDRPEGWEEWATEEATAASERALGGAKSGERRAVRERAASKRVVRAGAQFASRVARRKRGKLERQAVHLLGAQRAALLVGRRPLSHVVEADVALRRAAATRSATCQTPPLPVGASLVHARCTGSTQCLWHSVCCVMSPFMTQTCLLLHLNLHLTLRQRRWRGCAAIDAFSAELNGDHEYTHTDHEGDGWQNAQPPTTQR